MKKIMIMAAALFMGAVSSFGQGKNAQNPKDTVLFDKSFEDAGNAPSGTHDFVLVPKFYKAGIIAPEQPIALAKAKTEAMNLVRSKPTPLRKDCLNLIYTVDPIITDGSVTGALKGTVVIKWDIKRKIWILSYLKYQLVNIDQNACVFMYDSE